MATARKTAQKKTAAKKTAAKKSSGRTAPAKKSSSSASAAKTDATVLLERDHNEVKKLFKQYEKLSRNEADGQERQALAAQICSMLTVHSTIEEEIFYPASREAGVEHASAKDLIAQIQSMSPDDELYDAKVTVLGEYVNHHVEEEEGQMFPKCRRAKMDLAGLAQALAERKSELMAEQPA